MVTTKFNLEKFYGRNDFGLWRMKMKALLVHQGLVKAIDGEEPVYSEKAPEKEVAEGKRNW